MRLEYKDSPAPGMECRAKVESWCVKRVRSSEKVGGADHECNEERKVA